MSVHSRFFVACIQKCAARAVWISIVMHLFCLVVQKSLKYWKIVKMRKRISGRIYGQPKSSLPKNGQDTEIHTLTSLNYSHHRKLSHGNFTLKECIELERSIWAAEREKQLKCFTRKQNVFFYLKIWLVMNTMLQRSKQIYWTINYLFLFLMAFILSSLLLKFFMNICVSFS